MRSRESICGNLPLKESARATLLFGSPASNPAIRQLNRIARQWLIICPGASTFQMDDGNLVCDDKNRNSDPAIAVGPGPNPIAANLQFDWPWILHNATRVVADVLQHFTVFRHDLVVGVISTINTAAKMGELIKR